MKAIRVGRESRRYDQGRGIGLQHICIQFPGILIWLAHNLLDLHSKNIAFELPNSNSWTVEQIHTRFGEPIIHTVSRLDGQPPGPEVPPYTVEPAYPWTPGEEGLKKGIKIIDYGEASFSSEERTKLHTPMLLQPPESFFNESIGLPADIWAFGCAIFDIFGKRSLFEAFMPAKNSVLSELVSTLGILPQRWWDKWAGRSHHFLRDGAPNTISTTHYPPVLKRLALRVQQMRLGRGEQLNSAHEQLNAEDSVGLQKLLAASLRYEPSERATAKEVVESEWVQQLLRDSEAKDDLQLE